MSVCTFFGHRNCGKLDKALLYSAIEKQIGQGVDTFYVGNEGTFDWYVRDALRRISRKYPHIRYAVVLAYLPEKKLEYEDHSDTMYPEGLENGPPRFAIDRRNHWMIAQADVVVCYVCHTWGGAYKFTHMAKVRGKQVINLGNADIPL